MSVWDNPGEMLSRAQAARAQGDRELAYQMFARASELNPQDAIAWQGRAETATSSDEALVSYAYATALDGNNQALGRTLDAAVAARVAGSDKEDLGLLLALGQELAEVGLTERARSLFERATEVDPASTDAWVWLAGVTGDNNSQIDYLNRALATNPRDSRARAGLLAVKPPPAAPAPEPKPVSTPALKDELDTKDVNAILAHAALTNVPEEKEKLFERVLDLDPDNVEAKDGLSMLRVRRLRDSARTFDAVQESPLRRLKAPTAAPSADNRIRNIVIALVLLVVVLAVAGILLQMLQ